MSYQDDHDDDIGEEMNDRELFGEDAARLAGQLKDQIVRPEEDVPDDAIVGSLFAECGYLIDDLAEPEHVTVLLDCGREGLVETLASLDHMLLLLGTIRDEAAQLLAGLMEGDVESINGRAVTRSRSGDKTEWDRDGAFRAVRFAIIDDLGLSADGSLKQIEARLIERALEKMRAAGSWTPLVAGLKALNVNPNEWRAVTRGTRWNVKVAT